MKVKDLIEIAKLQGSRALEAEVCIPITRATASIGGRACSVARNCGLGIDWDSGKFFIYPTETLAVISEEQLDLVAEYREKLDRQYSKVLQTRADIKKQFLDLAKEQGVDAEVLKSIAKTWRVTGYKA